MTSETYTGPTLVHMGYIKTATTTLQHVVLNNPEFGFSMPAGLRSRGHMMEWLVVSDGYKFDPARMAEEIDEMERPVREKGLVPVWSGESLIGSPLSRQYSGPEAIRRLKASGRNYCVLLSFREQKSFALSAYREKIKRSSLPLEHFIGTGGEDLAFRSHLRPEFLEYDRAVEALMDAFGKERVLACPFEWHTREPDAFLAELHRLVGRPAGAEMPKAWFNKGLGGTALVSLRFLNRFIEYDPLNREEGALARLGHRGIRLINRLAPAALNKRIENGWKAQIAARYGDSFKDSNRRLAALIDRDLSPYGYY